MKTKKAGWNHVSRWYSKTVGSKGHFYHQELILPRLQEALKEAGSVLDLACGDGVLARALPLSCDYWGVDIAPNLIGEAKKKTPKRKARFLVSDVCRHLPLEKKDFDSAAIILACQDMPEVELSFQVAASHLRKGGRLHIVLNHPSFRIPKRTSWAVEGKLQYRRVDAYMQECRIPIQTKPSQGEDSPLVYSYHRPLSYYAKALGEAGFVIEEIDEWCSPKTSTGSKAKMENRARNEFPLFMYISCKKMH